MEMSKESYAYLATLPGYPSEYFDKLLSEPTLNEKIFTKSGEPQYYYEDEEKLKQRLNGEIFKPCDPVAMYYSSLAWVSYPYGIPVDNQVCPYQLKTAKVTEQVDENKTESDSILSDSESSSNEKQSFSLYSSSKNDVGICSSYSHEIEKPHEPKYYWRG